MRVNTAALAVEIITGQYAEDVMELMGWRPRSEPTPEEVVEALEFYEAEPSLRELIVTTAEKGVDGKTKRMDANKIRRQMKMSLFRKGTWVVEVPQRRGVASYGVLHEGRVIGNDLSKPTVCVSDPAARSTLINSAISVKMLAEIDPIRAERPKVEGMRELLRAAGKVR